MKVVGVSSGKSKLIKQKISVYLIPINSVDIVGEEKIL